MVEISDELDEAEVHECIFPTYRVALFLNSAVSGLVLVGELVHDDVHIPVEVVR